MKFSPKRLFFRIEIEVGSIQRPDFFGEAENEFYSFFIFLLIFLLFDGQLEDIIQIKNIRICFDDFVKLQKAKIKIIKREYS